MAYTDAQRRAHIYDLQNALYVLALWDNTRPFVIPDGIYGASTALAVEEHQQRNNLPRTGQVDYETWLSIFDEYHALRAQHTTPASVRPYRNPSFALQAGQFGAGIGIEQIMLWSVSRVYPNIPSAPLTVTLDEATQNALEQVKQIAHVEETGYGSATWNALTHLFNATTHEDF